MTRLSLTLLGGFQAGLGAGPPLRLRARKTQALLAYLALPAGQAHSRDKLAALLWGDGSQHHARSRLRETLFVLRRTLAPADPPCLDASDETVALTADSVDVDAVAFERLVETGGVGALGDAVNLYRGDLLQGLEFRGALFEDWLMAERERLREMAVEALAKLLAYQRSAGLAEPALQTALRLIALDPLQEAVHRTLMRLYAQLGRRGSALRQYQLCVGVLRRELGVEPEAETRKVYQEILRRRAGTGIPGSRRSPESASSAETLGAPLPVLTDIPLIGRESEIARGRAALVEAHAGRGQLMLVTGEAGVGKTRLIGELSTEAARQESHVLLGRCYESTQILPFGPWVDALRAGDVLADEDVLKELEPAWRAELTRVFPEIHTPGLPLSSDNDQRLFESVARVIEHLSRRQLVVLMLEDVHWADEMSLRLLAFVTRRIPSWRVLLVVTSRDEELTDSTAVLRTLDEIGRETHITRTTVAALTRRDTIDLVRSLARDRYTLGALAQLEQQVWTVSEGNPFVAVETMRAFQAGAVLPESASLPIPERVRTMIATRLSRLSPRAHMLAGVAAVIGRECEFRLLFRASGLDEGSAAEGVEELVRRRVLHGVGERFEFTHHRLQAVVHDELLAPRRKLLHRRVGEELEALSSGDPAREHLALGLHFREGEVWDKAASYLRTAGVEAMTRSAHREAATCFEQALAVLQHLPEIRERLEQAIDLRLDLRRSLHPLGELERGHEHLRDAERLARTLEDPSRLGWVSVDLSESYFLRREHAEARKFGLTALAIGEACADFRVTVAASFHLGMISNQSGQGDLRGAEDFYHIALRALGGDRNRERCGLAGFPAVQVRARLAQTLSFRGEFHQAIAHGQEAIRIAEELDDPVSLIDACYVLGFIYRIKGDLSQAARLLERGLALSDHWHIKLWLPALRVSLGYVDAWSGRVTEAISLLRSTAEEFESIYPRPETDWFLALGEACVLAGQCDEALSLARQALAFACERGLRGYEARSLRLLAEIAARRDPSSATESEAYYRQALGLAVELGAPPLVARCHLGLGELYKENGEPEKARTELTAAAGLYRSMEMTFWLERAERALTAF